MYFMKNSTFVNVAGYNKLPEYENGTFHQQKEIKQKLFPPYSEHNQRCNNKLLTCIRARSVSSEDSY